MSANEAVARSSGKGGVTAAGDRVWQAVNEAYELDAHEAALLSELCRTVDTLASLQRAVDREGVMMATDLAGTTRMHPALGELRQQRIVLAKLVAALRLPSGVVGVTDDKPTRQPRNQGYRRSRFEMDQDR